MTVPLLPYFLFGDSPGFWGSGRVSGLRLDVIQLAPEAFRCRLQGPWRDLAGPLGWSANFTPTNPRDFAPILPQGGLTEALRRWAGMVLQAPNRCSPPSSRFPAAAPAGAVLRARRASRAAAGICAVGRRLRPAGVALGGHYEGFDERIRGLADEEVSIA